MLHASFAAPFLVPFDVFDSSPHVRKLTFKLVVISAFPIFLSFAMAFEFYIVSDNIPSCISQDGTVASIASAYLSNFALVNDSSTSWSDFGSNTDTFEVGYSQILGSFD